jgi:N-methylhydantoinase A
VSFRVGIDIGGTFTDIVFLTEDGHVYTAKVPSTPDDYSRGIADGMRAVFAERHADGASVDEVIHGTTVATNAILEKKGARTGLITTEGFRDVLEIRRLRMPRLYDLGWQKPETLVPRDRRLEVRERIDHRGAVVHPLDEADAARVIDELLATGVDSVAVCLLNAYANGLHEARVEALIRARRSDLPVNLSSEILPEIREYERTSTTVVNAYVLPVVERYLGSLAVVLRELGVKAPLLIMQSNGGTMSAESAARRPIHIIESGPAAGVVGAVEIARKLGCADVLTFDMGGTTAKASIIEGGDVSRVSECEVGGGINLAGRLLRGGGYHVRVPAIDIAEVGAGGGSLVWIDRGGSMRVGPESAGADPGPVCYGRGGRIPTVTDANVVLGFLNPDYLVGGSLRLDADRAAQALTESIARPLGLEVAEAAWGVHVLANAMMARAVRAVSSERGRDPRQFVLMAFGGNGPVHAVTLARSLEIPRVVVPPVPGLFSALGLLFPEIAHHYVRTHKRRLDELALDDAQGVFDQLEAEGRRALGAEGYPDGRVALSRLVDARYLGENSELTIAFPDGVRDGGRELRERFDQEHERTYGYRSADEVVEVVNLRVIARGLSAFSRVPARLSIESDGVDRPARRRAYFGPEHGWRDVAVVSRRALGTREGPLIVEQYDTTIVIPPGCRATVDGEDNVIVDAGGPTWQ